MALEVRRIVTGHDSQGKAVVATDERLAGTGAAGRAGISRVDVWSNASVSAVFWRRTEYDQREGGAV